MDLFVIISMLFIVYYSVYLILPSLLDCDILLAFKEKYGKPISSLKGKTVWITGASAGIGENLAYVLAKAGCKLILSARRAAELERVKKTCLKENKCLTDDDVEVYPMDILDLDSHEKAFQHVINKFGKLDILVNNAGRSQRARWENIEIAVDKEMFNLNVFSVVSLSRLAVKHFLKIGGGHIINTSSLAGILPVPMSATYCGTKHALHGYFKPMFMEYPDKHIHVTMVCPGPVQTEFLPESFTEKSGEKYGVKTDTSKSKVSAERCATLMGVAIANKLDEVWICTASTLRITYMSYCFPYFTKWLIKNLGTKYLLKLRDANAAKD
ncbi:dehydrogenase/reductase SDR family member 7 [Temnothorax americanus]|uniref:dehydrogenase/reductase SDR family member 7 n=1 Tax=Temnothorax americanus TaxID=1964332 RepID=UPI0040690011